MNIIAKLIGRLLAVLVNSSIISNEQAEWILEPAREVVKMEES